MAGKHVQLRQLLTDAIIELCRKESFYVEELRIEGTLCLVSDRSSVLIAQITEQIGEHCPDEDTPELPLLDVTQAEELKNQQTEQSSQDDKGGDGDHGSKRKNDGEVVDHDDGPSTKSQKSSVLPQERTGGKYQCPFCPKAYNFKHSLKDHINKHTGRKPHVCKHCSMTFTHLGSLCAHVRRLHYHQMTSDYQCRICREKFMNDQSLKQHFNRRHQGETLNAEFKQESGSADLTSICSQDGTPQGGDNKGDKVDLNAGHHTFTEQKTDGSETASKSQNDQNALIAVKEEANDNTKSPDVDSAKTEVINPTGVAQVMQSFMQMFEGQHNNEQAALAQAQAQQVQAQILAAGLQGLQGMAWPSPQAQLAASMMNPFNPFMHPPTSSHPQVTGNPSVPRTPPPPPPAMSSRSTGTVSQNQAPPNLDLQRTPEGKFQCPYCEKMYNFKHTLKDHINKHMGKRPHVCKHCGDSFTHLASLCAHIKRRHDSQMPADYQCEICSEKFMNLQSLKQHFTWRHKDVKFSPQKILERSLRNNPPAASPSSSIPPKLHPVSATSQSNPRPDSVNSKNVQSIFPEAKYVTCSASTGNDILTNAVPIETTPEMNLQDCGPDLSFVGGDSEDGALLPFPPEDEDDVRPSMYISEYFSEVNLQTPHGFYKYKCKLCGNMFKIRNSLYEHLNSHLGKKPYICSHCGDAFTHHSTLHNHVRNRHSKQTKQEREAQFKHQCSVCNKKFRFPSELDRHIRSNPDHGTDGADESIAEQE